MSMTKVATISETGLWRVALIQARRSSAFLIGTPFAAERFLAIISGGPT